MPDLLAKLREAALADDPKRTEQVVLDIDICCLEENGVPELAVTTILELAQSAKLVECQVPAHLLNLFQFQARRLTPSQKIRILRFVQGLSGRFSHVHSAQVVTELVHGDYLRQGRDT